MKRKLIRAMKLGDLSGFQQMWALAMYDVHGPFLAMQYVNQIMIDKKLEGERV